MGLTTRLLFWERFDSDRTKKMGGDYKLLLNHASLTIPAPWTHRDALEAIARHSQMSVMIHSLADVLSKKNLPRGKTIFDTVGNAIDKIAVQYKDVYWWISKEGLNMAIVPPAARNLSPFDEAAGKLYVERSKDGNLSKELLVAIAEELDAARFLLKDHLPQAQRTRIAEYNQRNPRAAVKTFEKACLHRVFGRAVRRRLYVARGKYVKANTPVSSFPDVS
jgi:hypothetical protein